MRKWQPVYGLCIGATGSGWKFEFLALCLSCSKLTVAMDRKQRTNFTVWQLMTMNHFDFNCFSCDFITTCISSPSIVCQHLQCLLSVTFFSVCIWQSCGTLAWSAVPSGPRANQSMLSQDDSVHYTAHAPWLDHFRFPLGSYKLPLYIWTVGNNALLIALINLRHFAF